jgi:hypothetical protein
MNPRRLPEPFLEFLSSIFQKVNQKNFKKEKNQKIPKRTQTSYKEHNNSCFFEKVMKGTSKNGSGNHLRIRGGSGARACL